jgi:hypothetical protein
MNVADIMTRQVISVTPQTTIAEAARLLLDNRISGLPVVDPGGTVVGIVTEGDLLRRVETGTQRRHSHWLEFLIAPGRLAREYTAPISSGRCWTTWRSRRQNRPATRWRAMRKSRGAFWPRSPGSPGDRAPASM